MKYLAACLLLSIAATAGNIALWWSRPQAAQPVSETLTIYDAYDGIGFFANVRMKFSGPFAKNPMPSYGPENFIRAAEHSDDAMYRVGYSAALRDVAKLEPGAFSFDTKGWEEEAAKEKALWALSRAVKDSLRARLDKLEKRPLLANCLDDSTLMHLGRYLDLKLSLELEQVAIISRFQAAMNFEQLSEIIKNYHAQKDKRRVYRVP